MPTKTGGHGQLSVPRLLRVWGFWVASNTPKPDESPSGMRGNGDEATTSHNMKLYQSSTLI